MGEATCLHGGKYEVAEKYDQDGRFLGRRSWTGVVGMRIG